MLFAGFATCLFPGAIMDTRVDTAGRKEDGEGIHRAGCHLFYTILCVFCAHVTCSDGWVQYT